MEKIYYTNQYIKEFIADIVEILEIDNKYHILLNKTAFFPGGGGQFCDLGTIDIQNVIDVYEKEGKVYHILEKKPINIHNVKCKINWDRREDGMHQHFGQHVLSGSFFKLLNANTVSFHLGKEISTVDIEGILNEDQIRKVESYANEVINQNIKVETLIPSKKDIKKIWIRRKLPDTSEDIRILKIGELDSNACCGVHPSSTLELKMIKIKRWEKNKEATRIEFLAGKRAINYSLKRDKCLKDICKYLNCSDEEALKGIKNLYNKLEITIENNKKLEDEVINYEISSMIKNSIKIDNIAIVKNIYNNKDIKYAIKIASKLSNYDNTIILLGIKNEDKANLIFTCSKNIEHINMNTLLNDSITLIEGRGGGNSFLSQGGGKNNGNLELAIECAISKIKKIQNGS